MGAIRWDNWDTIGVPGSVLASPDFAQRLPAFAERRADGSIRLQGSGIKTLASDVADARRAGIDYFLFGYYLETGAWGRNVEKARSVNRAYATYRALPDKQGVRFALSFNWTFPRVDLDEVVRVLIDAVGDPSYVTGEADVAPVFFFTPELGKWVDSQGGPHRFADMLAEIGVRVLANTGRSILPVALVFNVERYGDLAMRAGFKAASTYANGLGGGGVAVPYEGCMRIARSFWRQGARAPLAFFPTVTFGWDYRPILSDPEESRRKRDPSWCEPALPHQWKQQILDAIGEAAGNQKNKHFNTILLYAWNEFGEGGWIAPTIAEGARRVEIVSEAISARHCTASK